MSPSDPTATAPVAPAQMPRQVKTRSFATFRTVAALVLREMSARYGRSPGGYVWAILEPLGGILVLSFAFSLMLRSPSLGNSFLLFYATGFLPFSIYQNISNTVARAIGYSKPLLRYPSVTWVDALLARFLLNTLTAVMIAYILLAGILTLTEAQSVLRIGYILEAFCLTALLGLGVGVMNCLISGIFPVWEMIWSILTRPLFIASGVFHIMEDLPRNAQAILWYNPVLHLTGLMRKGFYPMYTASWISVPFVVGVSMVLLVLGLVLLQRYHKDILNN